MSYDLLIRNAFLADGTGAASYLADIGISGNRISAVGLSDSKWKARRVLNADGKTVTPGIIDPHSHADLIFPLESEARLQLLSGKLFQGITSTIIGNCGLGCAPLGSDKAEGILRAVNAWMTPHEVSWKWRRIGEYLKRLEDSGLPMNLGTLAPHGPIRMSAMGLAKGKPLAREIRLMRRLVEESLEDGALGLSSGLIYPPGMYSAPEELNSLAKVVAAWGGIYTSHIRGSSETLVEAVAELIDTGRKTGVSVHHSHNEAVGRHHWKKIDQVLGMETRAAAEGVRLSFDMFPYTAAATMMVAIYPPWTLEGGVDALIERLKQPGLRSRIRREIERTIPSWPPWVDGGWPHNLVKASGWAGIQIGYVESRRNKRFEGRSLAELGELTGKNVFDAISDLIIEEQGKVSMLIFDVSGERDSIELLRRYAAHPSCAFCTDAEDYGRGLPHPAAYGAFPRILSRFVDEENGLSFEEAIRKMTSLPASIFGIKDRGVIRPGAFADLLVLDRSKIKDTASYAKPRKHAKGIETVINNGTLIIEDGVLTGRQAGMLMLRGQ